MDAWESLQNAWQSAAVSTIDVPALRRQAQRKRRRMFALEALEVLLTVAMTVYLLLVGLPAPLHTGSLLPWLLVAAIWAELLVKTWLRLASWNVKNLGAAGLLELHIRRAWAGIAFAWASIIALLIVYALWMPTFWRLWLSSDPTMHGVVIPNIIANGIFFALVVAWAIWCGLRQRRQLRRTRELLEQLENEAERL
jgi:hypothetical protein